MTTDITRKIRERGNKMKKLTVRGISTHEESKGEWKCGYLIEDEGISYIINSVVEANDEYITIGEWCSVEPETLGISTGLPDEDGTEIFEGDIVRQVRTQPTTENETITGVVTMIEGAWLIMNDNKQLASYLWSETDKNEVIGNIYENSELLEG